MSLLATDLATDAATALHHRDALLADRLATAEDEIDALRTSLFAILFTADWSYGVQPAVDTVLISRYYERFADHALALADQVRYLATGHPAPSAA
jgi:phosphate transport system protein